jgi:Flp pilus assembly protein TadG
MRLGRKRPQGQRRPRDARRGSTAVEFALVLPLFCAMMFAAIDYGWYFYQKFTLASAVQGGIRAALSVTEQDTPSPWQTACTAAKALLDNGGIIAGGVCGGTSPPGSVDWGPASNQYGGSKPGRYVILTGTFKLTPLMGFVPLPATTISYSATMTLDAQNAAI